MFDYTQYIYVLSHQCVFVSVMLDHSLCANALPHTVHLCSFTPVCVNICLDKSPFREKTVHLCALTPVCISKCIIKLYFRVHVLSHMGHLCAFTLVCVSKYNVRLYFRVNALSQTVHLNTFSPVCVLKGVLLDFPSGQMLFYT